MLMMPARFDEAVISFNATAPDMDGEDEFEYMAVSVTFDVVDIEKFGRLWKDACSYPKDRHSWYHLVRDGADSFLDEEKLND